MNVWLCGAPCGARVRNPCAFGGRPGGLLLRAVRPDICKPCANAAGLTKRQNFAPFCLHGAEGGDKMGGFRLESGDFRREVPTFVRKVGGIRLCRHAVFGTRSKKTQDSKPHQGGRVPKLLLFVDECCKDKGY